MLLNSIQSLMQSTKYEKHPSSLKINEINEQETFYFHPTEFESIIQEILVLDTSNASPKDSIPPKIIKDNCDILSYKLLYDFNFSVTSVMYPDNLKYADVSPAFKKGDRLDKENYRPISILPAISKIFERLFYYQINNYMDPKLPMHQCEFRKHLSAQNCLLVMLVKWRKCLDNNDSTSVLLADLSKAFDCLFHNISVAKLNAYGFDFNSL